MRHPFLRFPLSQRAPDHHPITHDETGLRHDADSDHCRGEVTGPYRAVVLTRQIIVYSSPTTRPDISHYRHHVLAAEADPLSRC